VRSPTAARRSGRPTGAARRRACPATFIDTGRDNSGRESEGASRRGGRPERDASQHRPARGPGCRSAVYHRASVATRLETASSFETATAARDTGRAADKGNGPLLVLGAIVVGAFLLYVLLATGVDGPRVHPDEELYTMGASSLAGGQGLTLRGQHFGFGPLFPALLAAIIRLTGSVDAAYEWFKFANAFCFALTAVPVYLLARRLASAWWAVLAAGLSVAIPSAISIGTVMTESVSYPATALALYATAVALERPTVFRQFAVLAAVAVAFLIRPQFGVLYATWIGALGILWLIAPRSRTTARADRVRI